MPMQEFRANTTTREGENVDNRTSSANITIPVSYAYASGTIGFILLILGLIIPNPNRRSNSKKDSYDKVIESKENIEIGDGNKRKIIREKTEKHNSKKGKNDN
ncbi:hypothetical protein COU54_01685 [Candidatus Pacearchaeota archaeon CG10_big_fil_rev_8_21_14_0_10_31_24]|nr:MAG: hypothetical protein COU54_01685 [Candidatus Pacearchaeota archaeon CG10_big_fil_rev_8_21_14_0_10_31_24]